MEHSATMNRIFKKSRSVSPSFEIPKICLPRQSECVDDGYDLEVNKTLKVPTESRGRSSSFDSSSLRQDSFTKECLSVPSKQGRRCHSFDSACSLQINSATSEESLPDGASSPTNWSLKVPKYQGKRASLDLPKLCIHCIHMEAKAQESHEREQALKIYQAGPLEDSDGLSFTSSTSYTSTTPDSMSDPSGFYYLSDSEDEGNESDCEDNNEYQDLKDTPDSVSSKKKFGFRSNSCSDCNEKSRILDFLNGHNLPHIDSKDDEDYDDVDEDEDSDDEDENDDDEDYINAVTLTVPTIKQQRSSSMDACFLKTNDGGQKIQKQVQRQKSFDNGDMLDVPMQTRSSSVDVNLPTEQQNCYVAIPHSDSR